MVCTYCGSRTRIKNSRWQQRANAVWRRRACQTCGRIFTTIEQVDYEKSWLVDYLGGKPRPFLRDTLLLSLYRSLQHRPTSLPDALELAATIIGRLQRAQLNGHLTPVTIAAFSYEVLRRFDTAAAVSYKAFHSDAFRRDALR